MQSNNHIFINEHFDFRDLRIAPGACNVTVHPFLSILSYTRTYIHTKKLKSKLNINTKKIPLRIKQFIPCSSYGRINMDETRAEF